MTNSELVETYLEKQGMRRIKGTNEDFSPLLPYLMLDAVYQMWCKTIKPIECKFELNKYKNTWNKNYNEFNRQFFNCFNIEQRDAIIDKMDDFEQYIGNDITIAKVQVMNCINFETLDRQDVLATCMLCSILAQSARIVWGRVYKNAKFHDEKNGYISTIEKSIKNFMDTYYGKGKPNIKCDEDKKVSDAVSVLCKKMIYWLYK